MYHPKKWEWVNRSTAVWLTGLPDGNHKIQVRVKEKKNAESKSVPVSLGKVVTYRGEVARMD